jgi:hypothetical protein
LTNKYGIRYPRRVGPMTDEKTYARVVLTGVDIPFGEMVNL